MLEKNNVREKNWGRNTFFPERSRPINMTGTLCMGGIIQTHWARPMNQISRERQFSS